VDERRVDDRERARRLVNQIESIRNNGMSALRESARRFEHARQEGVQFVQTRMGSAPATSAHIAATPALARVEQKT
jgi:histidinol dehydrogenase